MDPSVRNIVIFPHLIDSDKAAPGPYTRHAGGSGTHERVEHDGPGLRDFQQLHHQLSGLTGDMVLIYQLLGNMDYFVTRSTPLN